MANIFDKWHESLTKTRNVTFGRIANFFGTTEFNEDSWDELEALLIQADLGVETTSSIIENCMEKVRKQGLTRTEQLYQLVKEELINLLDQPEEPDLSAEPTVIMIAGVNGSGKTTSIAKLAARYKKMGKKVLLVAGDTFRAAAADQLEIWSERVDVPIARRMDVVLIDTAGRLHTRYNLMEEIKKVYRVAGKALPGAPHHSWIVLDATTGQNALQQAKAFQQAVDLNGAILAKLDSSAKGGMAFAIKHQLNLPILYAGLGEGMDDLQLFDRNAFVDGILER